MGTFESKAHSGSIYHQDELTMHRFLLIASILMSTSKAANGALCNDVLKTCGTNLTCAQLSLAYLDKCTLTILGQNPCSSECKANAQSLYNDPIGKAFKTCTCDLNPPSWDFDCVVQNDNIAEACFGEVPPTADTCTTPTEPPHPILQKCTDWISFCQLDSDCNQTLALYLGACNGALTGTVTTCSGTCRARLHDLRCNGYGSRTFAGCICDANEPECFKFKTNLDSTCFNRKYPQPPPTRQRCAYVETACKSDSACNALVNTYQTACSSMFSGLSTTCSKACNDSFAALVKNPIGYHYLSCSCDDDLVCQQNGALTSFYCLGKVWEVPQECDNIIGACTVNKACNATTSTYVQQCDDEDPSDNVCPCHCVEPFKKIQANPIGARIQNCYCDKDDEQCLKAQDRLDDCLSPKKCSAAAMASLAFSALLLFVACLLL
eukprot:m.306141 g.306141  ORF g.306141 m.306141 type:complete len:436 (+) comp41004_c0_seq1:1533-2840(+)